MFEMIHGIFVGMLVMSIAIWAFKNKWVQLVVGILGAAIINVVLRGLENSL